MWKTCANRINWKPKTSLSKAKICSSSIAFKFHFAKQHFNFDNDVKLSSLEILWIRFKQLELVEAIACVCMCIVCSIVSFIMCHLKRMWNERFDERTRGKKEITKFNCLETMRETYTITHVFTFFVPFVWHLPSISTVANEKRARDRQTDSEREKNSTHRCDCQSGYAVCMH